MVTLLQRPMQKTTINGLFLLRFDVFTNLTEELLIL